MKIGELSELTGASARSLRYYEDLGLIRSTRQPNGYRDYDEQALDFVVKIRSFIDLGFPTNLISQILPCTGDAGPIEGDCAALMSRVREIRDEMDDKARRAADTRDVLTAFLAQAESSSATTVS
jgi:DNA-binding transcriptional MerR regulator